MLYGNVAKIIERLEKNGYKAYAVGGFVRDKLRGVLPSDFDIATNALPEETKKVFSDKTVIETGIAHGTVTVIWEKIPYEITTFRKDGEYKDSRHPESVSFTNDIVSDLARRDFTVNSMAIDASGRIIDPYGGREDLENGIIKCTGNPCERLKEDALRILRALRFASVLDFKIEEKTAGAIHSLRYLINNVSVERVFTEIKKLLCGKGVFIILSEYSDVICTVIPEMTLSVNCEHKSKYHIYDVYTHVIKSVEAAEPDPLLRLALLFHDIGKPYCMSEQDGVRHFKGHPEISAEIAQKTLKRLHADNHTVETVTFLCKYHDMTIEPCEKSVRRLFLKMPYEAIVLLCKLKMADSAAHNPKYNQRGKEAEQILHLAEKINAENQCVKIKDLAVNGNDIKELGFSGPDVGKVLEKLLCGVIDEVIENKKSSLIEAANKMKK